MRRDSLAGGYMMTSVFFWSAEASVFTNVPTTAKAGICRSPSFYY